MELKNPEPTNEWVVVEEEDEEDEIYVVWNEEDWGVIGTIDDNDDLEEGEIREDHPYVPEMGEDVD